MRYTHIVFDIDGTMTDTEAPLMQALQDTIVHVQGRKLPLSELHFAFGLPSEDTYRQLGVEDIPAADAYWQQRFKVHATDIQLFHGIRDALRDLKKHGHTLGVITSKSRQEFIESFSIFGLDELFSLVVCCDDTQRHKPNPEPMQFYLKHMNARPEHTLYVGDTSYDMRCAHGAGCAGALATWGNKNPDAVSADYYPMSPDELIPIGQGLIDPRPIQKKN